MKLSLCPRSSFPRAEIAEPLPPPEDVVVDPGAVRVEAPPQRKDARTEGWLTLQVNRAKAPRTPS